MMPAETALADLHRAFRDELLRRGLLISLGVDGLYGRSGVFEHLIDRINAAISTVGDPDRPEVIRFPPGIGKWQLEKSGYTRKFPQLAGTVYSFFGSDREHRALIEMLDKDGDRTVGQESTQVALTPAACYGSDAAVIAARCGAALVVARKNKGRVEALQDLVANLSETPAKLAGVVYNEF